LAGFFGHAFREENLAKDMSKIRPFDLSVSVGPVRRVLGFACPRFAIRVG
jgi:hypothetical protein